MQHQPQFVQPQYVQVPPGTLQPQVQYQTVAVQGQPGMMMQQVPQVEAPQQQQQQQQQQLFPQQQATHIVNQTQQPNQVLFQIGQQPQQVPQTVPVQLQQPQPQPSPVMTYPASSGLFQPFASASPQQQYQRTLLSAPQPPPPILQTVSPSPQRSGTPQKQQQQQQVVLVSPGNISSAGGSLSSYPTTTHPLVQTMAPGTPQPQATVNVGNMVLVSPGSSLTGYPPGQNLNLSAHSGILTGTSSRTASLTGYPGQPRPPPPQYSGATSGTTLDMSRSVASMPSAGNSMTRIPIDNSTWGYALVDPLHPRLQRVPIAPSAIVPSAGVQLYERDVVASSAKPCLSAVCLKHNMPEGCSLGAQCPNFHVNTSYLEKARKVWDPICCAHHNCYFSQEMQRSGQIAQLLSQRFVLIFDRAEVELSASQIAFTVGLEQLPLRAGNTRVITGKSLCRLHFDSKCKWTKDCSHIHVCRELFKFLQAFHYPSLSFLLMTETDEDKIVAKVQSQKMVVEFLLSSCSEPLIKQLQENGKQAALSAVRRCQNEGGAAPSDALPTRESGSPMLVELEQSTAQEQEGKIPEGKKEQEEADPQMTPVDSPGGC